MSLLENMEIRKTIPMSLSLHTLSCLSHNRILFFVYQESYLISWLLIGEWEMNELHGQNKRTTKPSHYLRLPTHRTFFIIIIFVYISREIQLVQRET